MALFLNNKVGVKIDSVDFTTHIQSASLTRQFNELDVTAMGDTAVRMVKGLENSTFTISLLNDDAADGVRHALQSAWGKTVNCKLIQDAGSAVGTTNPIYTFTILVNKTTDVNGATGDMGKQDITFTVNSAVDVAYTGTW